VTDCVNVFKLYEKINSHISELTEQMSKIFTLSRLMASWTNMHERNTLNY